MEERPLTPVDRFRLVEKSHGSPAGKTRHRATVLAFVNQKGGTGKTTITQNLAVCLALQHRKRVLCIDLDPQGNLGQSLMREPASFSRTADRLLLVPSANIHEYCLSVRDSITIVPNRYQRDLRENVERLPSSENLLKKHLERISDQYDYILIDTPAGLCRSTQAAVDTADEVVVVVSCGSYTLRGTAEVMNWVGDLSARAGRRAPVVRIVLNNFDERRKFDREFREQMLGHYGAHVFQTQIRTSVRIVEASANGVGVLEYQPVSMAATDFKRLSREFLGLPISVVEPLPVTADILPPVNNAPTVAAESHLKLVRTGS
ncbi:MAG: ParA family protein [Blastocatellia bacterium]